MASLTREALTLRGDFLAAGLPIQHARHFDDAVLPSLTEDEGTDFLNFKQDDLGDSVSAPQKVPHGGGALTALDEM